MYQANFRFLFNFIVLCILYKIYIKDILNLNVCVCVGVFVLEEIYKCYRTYTKKYYLK